MDCFRRIEDAVEATATEWDERVAVVLLDMGEDPRVTHDRERWVSEARERLGEAERIAARAVVGSDSNRVLRILRRAVG